LASRKLNSPSLCSARPPAALICGGEKSRS
jgi:hypothetical protein